jgi:hypothetical protein
MMNHLCESQFNFCWKQFFLIMVNTNISQILVTRDHTYTLPKLFSHENQRVKKIINK